MRRPRKHRDYEGWQEKDAGRRTWLIPPYEDSSVDNDTPPAAVLCKIARFC
jgi:hypothetical protein